MERKKIIPLSLRIIGNCVYGVVFELFPLLLSNCLTQHQLDIFGSDMMDLIGDRYDTAISGSVLWVLYKYMCEKNINAFLNCVSTIEKQMQARDWLRENNKKFGLTKSY